MKIIFTLIVFSLALNSFGQQKPSSHTPTKNTACSVIQESGNLEYGYPSDYSQYAGLDDFTVPANECWSIAEIKANFFQVSPSNEFGYNFDIYALDGTDLYPYNYAYSSPGEYSVINLGNVSSGPLAGSVRYQFDFNLESSIELCGGPTGTTYWISIYSDNVDQTTPTVWEADTTQANNYGLDLLVYNPNTDIFYTGFPGADFVFEIVHRSYSMDTRTECSPYTWIDGHDYTSNVQHVEYLVPGGAANGCDSVVFLNLTVNQPATGIDHQTACNAYTWIDGNTYFASNNTALFTLNNAAANGCDSIVTLDLTINQPAMGIDHQTACNSFTWIDGNTYMASNNTAQFTLNNAAANGCDSIVLLDLTLETVSSSITENADGSLTASGGTSFQWLNCSDNTPVAGETNATFTPSVNGSYSVIAYNNGSSCSDTSACVAYNHAGLNFLATISLSVFPNPASEAVTVIFNAEEAQLNIYDEQGRLTFSGRISSGKNISVSQFAKGIYRLEVLNDQGIVSERFVKM